MKVFDKYADYYDLIYKDKDYAAEADFIDGLIKKHHPGAKTILNLGCGTGSHDFLLAQKGYNIKGIDCSESNIKKANAKLTDVGEYKNCLDFQNGDIRTYRANKTYDIVISLFHVISYQITNEDLKSVFETVKIPLNKNGLFIFDCWYGPAVLHVRPEIRIKEVENNRTRIIRIAEPEIFPNENKVHVNYRLLVVDKVTNNITEIRETHPMRYLFKPEIDELLFASGLKVVECAEWMTNKSPGFDTWSIYFIATPQMDTKQKYLR
ncbi:class I SAM-dependent methyltransferase [Candidatus Kuenenia sp.]|uniref:class I SAM-dependent DNA methyltransferase n=1 Tax=Candidatus Kuenenia sp. TaxID=2499824 RepID=UPI00321F6782